MKKILRHLSLFSLLGFFVLTAYQCGGSPSNSFSPPDATLAEERENAEATETAMAPFRRGNTFLSDASNSLLGEVKFNLPAGPLSDQWGHLHPQLLANFSGEQYVQLSRNLPDGTTVWAMSLDFSETGFLTVISPGGELRVVYSSGDIWEGSIGGTGFYVRFTDGQIQFH